MVRLHGVLLLISVITACALLGCGGSDNGAVAPSGSGSLAVVVEWPAQTRVVPEMTNSMTVNVSRNGIPLAWQTINRPSEGASTTEAVFPDLPAGTVQYSLVAYAEPLGMGVVVGTASGTAAIRAGERTRVYASSVMVSAVAGLQISADNSYLTMFPGMTQRFYATGVNAENQIVPLGERQLRWSITGLNSDLATVDRETGQVTTVNNGRTGMFELTAHDPESGVRQSISVRLDTLIPVLYGPTIARVGEDVSFTLWLRLPDGADLSDYTAYWDLDGDGGYESQPRTENPVHYTYTQPGWYTVTVSIQAPGREQYLTAKSNPFLVMP